MVESTAVGNQEVVSVVAIRGIAVVNGATLTGSMRQATACDVVKRKKCTLSLLDNSKMVRHMTCLTAKEFRTK